MNGCDGLLTKWGEGGALSHLPTTMSMVGISARCLIPLFSKIQLKKEVINCVELDLDKYHKVFF